MSVALDGAMTPIMAFSLIGALGVGSQWLAWRLNMPAIVLMLLVGVIVGPVTGVLDPARDIGDLISPMISVAVAIILFEGGLTLNVQTLRDAAKGVMRLVLIGAPLGWLTSALALHFGAGLGWEASAVLGGIMIVTGPTVIAPLLRTARLSRRPAALLQWEAIINDPIGALAAVLAFQAVLILHTATTVGAAVVDFLVGVAIASALGALAGIGLSAAFKRGHVPEFMKVPVLFAVLLACFALADTALHESGLLAVTIMGIVIANADLPSYEELRRFKEHATVLLVSGVFILLAASLDVSALERLDWRAIVFVLAVVFVARPLTVAVAFVGTDIPVKERVLIALTGPRGVVLVAVAGLFGSRLVDMGIEDGALFTPLAFALVAVTVVLHGFTLVPFARFLGLAEAESPGVLLVGGSRFSRAFAEVLVEAEIPVLMTDPNRNKLRTAREAGIPTFYGDILSEAAEHSVELVSYATVIAATDNDAYNTLVTTDLAPEFGRAHVFQIGRTKGDHARHALPTTLGGKKFGKGETYDELNALLAKNWAFCVTPLTEDRTYASWRADNAEAILFARISPSGELRMTGPDEEIKPAARSRLISLQPPGSDDSKAKVQKDEAKAEAEEKARKDAKK